jgi:hypothetical protein
MVHPQAGRRRFLAAALIGLLGLGAALVGRARADDVEKLDNSLKWIPEDAAFYSSMLRNREQVEAVAHSRAWAKLKELPAVQMALQQLQADPRLAQVREVFETPENRQLLAMLGDMVSHEIFIYGGRNFVAAGDRAGRAGGSGGFGRGLAKMMAARTDEDRKRVQIQLLLHSLADNVDLIRMPDLVIGFKLQDTKRAEAQLKRLEDHLSVAAAQLPPLEGRVKRVQVEKGSILTLNLDGKMVPWDRIPFKDYEDKPGEFDKLVDKLGQLKLVIGLGVKDDYLLLSLGDSVNALTKLGQDKLLYDRAEFKPLRKYAKERLTSIGYVSKAFNARMATSKQDIDNFVKTADEYLPRLDLPEEQRARIRKDLQDLARDLKPFITEPGASLAFSFLNGRGKEGYSYRYGEFPGLDGSKPLTLLEHVGGNPLCAAVSRSKSSPEGYRLLVKWIKVANRYVEDLLVPQLNAEQKEHYDVVTKIAYPLLRRVDEATGKMLLPSLADGQTGLVLDAKIKSKQWFRGMPESDTPLPMLEPALVLGVSDADLLRRAFAEYRAIGNDAIAKVREVAGDRVPDVQIPEPETRKVANGTIYFYPIPNVLGLDEQISPNAGLSEGVAILAIAQSQTERLLARHPLKVDGGPLADLNLPLVAATHVNCAEVVNAVGPWVEYGIQQGYRRQRAEGAERGGDDAGAADVLAQVRTVLEVLKVFRSYSSITYFEGGALVTHRETVIRDVGAP